VPIEKKESFRWLDNLRQSTALLNDPGRCVHIGDRESDICELFCTTQDVGTHFLLRTCVDRLAGDGTRTISSEMAELRCKGVHRIQVSGWNGQLSEALLELRFHCTQVLSPSANKIDIRRSPLRSYTPQNVVARVTVSQSNGN
jgi:hypothetical protein